MSILELATRYHNRVGGSPRYLEQLQVLARRLPWQASELTPDLIDAYLTQALKTLAPSTVDNHRRMLRSLLKFAAAERLVDASIVRPLRRVKMAPPNPRAWSHAELARLVAVASETRGGTRKCPYRLLLPAWILTGYSTGLRLEDLLALQHIDLRGDKLCLPQHKTGWPHVVRFDANALEAVRKLPVVGPRIFGSLIGRSQILVAMRRLVKRAGLTGSTKWCRRSGATYCEIAGNDSTQYLGHKTPGMKVRYVDRLLLAEERPDNPIVPSVPLLQAATQ